MNMEKYYHFISFLLPMLNKHEGAEYTRVDIRK